MGAPQEYRDGGSGAAYIWGGARAQGAAAGRAQGNAACNNGPAADNADVSTVGKAASSSGGKVLAIDSDRDTAKMGARVGSAGATAAKAAGTHPQAGAGAGSTSGAGAQQQAGAGAWA